CRVRAPSTRIWRITCAATAKKWALVLPIGHRHIYQLQPRLVGQRRGLQSMAIALVFHVIVSSPPQLGVDRGRELVQRVPIAICPSPEQPRDCDGVHAGAYRAAPSNTCPSGPPGAVLFS